jgi:hypothetical protein
MRKPEHCPSNVIDIPHRVQKDGWWLVIDNTIPCTGPDRRCSGLPLIVIGGVDQDHADSRHKRDD